MMEGYDNFEQYARRARLIAQRNVEGRVYLQEQQRLIGPEDAVEKVNELYAAAQNDYEHFRSLLQIGDKNIPTRIVPHDEDLFKPISEKSARLLYQTLKEGTFKETGLSAQDTGLGAEITLTTCIGADEQTLIFAVKKEGISGLNIDDAFEDYGRWDFTCYTSLEDSARVLDSAYSVAYSRSYPAFSDLFRKGQVGLPSPPDEEGERFRPHPILEADIRELYSSLFDSVRRDAPRVWYSDNGNGIEVIFSLRGLTLQGTQYSREYVIAMRDGHIIGCKITDTDSNVARR